MDSASYHPGIMYGGGGEVTCYQVLNQNGERDTPSQLFHNACDCLRNSVLFCFLSPPKLGSVLYSISVFDKITIKLHFNA